MEQPLPNNHPCPPFKNKVEKPSNVISWLGFSFSLFVLILLWFTMIIATFVVKNNSNASFYDVEVLFLIFLLIVIPFGLAGLVLSIVGLAKAANTGGKKWIGIWGLVFTFLSCLSMFAPIFVNSISAEEAETLVPDKDSVYEKQQSKGVVIFVEGNQLKCYDNRIENDNEPYETRIKPILQLNKELEVWFNLHKVAKNETIKIIVSKDTDYGKVSELLDALNWSDRTNIQLTND